MNRSVSVIIPTIGRASLRRAVESALEQTHPVTEVVVVVDALGAVADVPDDSRVSIVRTPGGLGSSRARQFGIDRSVGDVIALLDDDDEWMPEKMSVQLAAVEVHASADWICASRFDVSDGSGELRTWPRRLIGVQEPVGDYIFGFTSLKWGGASVQTSTLCFPRSVVDRAPWDLPAGSLHDDPSWLISVRRAIPTIPIVQVDRSLVLYHLTQNSLSRTGRDESDAYIDWGRDYLGGSSARTRGDYFFTSPVTTAVAGRSFRGILRSVWAGLRFGRPGPWATAYASIAVLRVLVGRAKSSLAQGDRR